MLYASAAVQIGPRRVAEKSRMGFSPFLAQLRLRDACVSGITSGHLRVFLTKTLTQGFPKALQYLKNVWEKRKLQWEVSRFSQICLSLALGGGGDLESLEIGILMADFNHPHHLPRKCHTCASSLLCLFSEDGTDSINDLASS